MKKIGQLLTSHVPSSNEMDALASQIEEVLNQLKGTSTVYTRWDAEVRNLKVDVTASGAATPDKIPIKDGKVDPTTWDSKSEEEKRRLFGMLDTAFTDLRCVNQDRLACGKTWFGWLSVFFGVIVGLYLFLHSGWWGSRLSPHKTTAIWEQVRRIEFRLGEIKAGKAEGNVSDVKPILNDLTNLLGELERQTGASLHLPFETSRLLGAVSAEAALNDPTVHQTFQELVKKLKADLESSSTAYFWITAPGRWFEIAWWAERSDVWWDFCFTLQGSAVRASLNRKKAPCLWPSAL